MHTRTAVLQFGAPLTLQCRQFYTLHVCGQQSRIRVVVQEGEDLSTGPFEDEETRALYESLPDIRALVPALLLGTAEGQQTVEEEGAEQPMEVDASADNAPADADAVDSRPEASQENTTGISSPLWWHSGHLVIEYAGRKHCVHLRRSI